MSAKAGREQGVVAYQLLGKLGDYEEEVCALVEEWPETARLAGIDTLLCDMQELSGIFPHLADAWAQLLASHTELQANLTAWTGPESQRFDWLESHVATILQLEAACLAVLAGKA